ncbi:Cobalt-zinc-cadmium resistance protein CzcA [Posidoniimonas polymericola]|uniref:Cobalt-zinc-cadmium resistance protein CzcA n=1 Tax=Posidoniimonas polymericola TaxID=2528002 RepID=A0A5C5XXW7_9BACT|nr:efflux RND transporter permease subunit [Posidoniimonas polymericola]TWT66755.1 Cobalt-zinc-cadmium resistance protein CzcA [Posidoniimonas polymericola]
MLNAIIRFALTNRPLVLAAAVAVLGVGVWQALRLPIDVFPDLNRPRVVIMTEAHGLAPEEVETLVTFPLETALNGVTGVEAVRSSSGIGLSVIYVEFEWGTDIYDDRQIVSERVAVAQESLPRGVRPQLMPISSLMGQIMVVGMQADERVSPMELRTIADWTVRQRLLAIKGVSQIIVMGGERRQLQVLVDPDRLIQYGVSLQEVKEAIADSNQNTTGGYLDEQGPNELLVRSLGRVHTVAELRDVVVTHRDRQSVTLSQVATVVEGPQVKRGDSSAFVRADETSVPGDSVLLTVLKQPRADTRKVTEEVLDALRTLSPTLPEGVRITPSLYQQRTFIDLAVQNVVDALRDGSLLVVVCLFAFLLSLRTTFITLTAIPLSIAVTAIVFAMLGLSVNTMTLGGLAVAIGELVDDAIVDVENIYRRLRENRASGTPRHPLQVVYQASIEVRGSIVYGTMIVVLVFVPLFALSGMEGRLFTPLGIAYIVSILSSLLVSLTLTPVLSYLLLGRRQLKLHAGDSFLVRLLKAVAGAAVAASVRWAAAVILLAAVAVGVAGWAMVSLERDFLPPFNEGAVQVNVLLPPGASLAESNRVAGLVEKRLVQIPDILSFARKTGRAELDEHAEGVNVTEYIATIDPASPRSREEVIDEISAALAETPGVVASVEQPIAHLISHMLSGVKAQVAIKLYGPDLDTLRAEAEAIRNAIKPVPGVRDLIVELQSIVPQLRVEADGEKLRFFGLRRADVNELIETAMQGEVISQVREGQRTFDLLVRFGEQHREDIDSLRRLRIDLPAGGSVKLEDVANIYRSGGPNTIKREQVSRRIAVQCNVSGRGLVDVVNAIKQRLEPIVAELPTGYYIEYGGQFESQQVASRVIGLLFLVSLVGMFLVLYKMFGSANLALQVMVALPMAFIGSVAALWLTGQTLTIASMVGFISLCGIASRNGILLLSHYLNLVRHEGEGWTREMLVRAGQERLSPMLMTALTSGIGLAPLALSAGEPGKEILYPVATVIIGGLITCTLLEFLVRPAMFWTFGLDAARRVVESADELPPLDDSQDGERRFG